jgi:protein CpxP
MKKLLSLALLLSGIGFGAFAQEDIKKHSKDKKSYVRKEYVSKDMVKISPEQIAEKRTEQLDKQLKFSDSQRKEVFQLQLDQARKLKKQQEIRAKEREIARKERKEQREVFEKLLTPEQKSAWKEKLANRSEPEFKKGKERRGDFRKGESKRKIEKS